MKEMYYILGLAGWIWLGLVAPLMIGAWIVQLRRKATQSRNTDPDVGDEKQS